MELNTQNIVKELLRVSGHNQYTIKVAKFPHVHQSAINKMVNGKRKITIEKLSQLAESFGLDITFKVMLKEQKKH